MALQTKVYTKTSNTFTLELTLVENSTSTSNNTSSISYTLKLKSTTKDFYDYGVGATVVLDGRTVATRDRYSASKIGIGTYSSVTLLAGTTTVTHDSDGEKTMSIRYTLDMASASYTPGPMDASGSMTLTSIGRGATITSAPNFTDEDSPKIEFSNPAGGTVQVGIYKTDGYTALASYRTATGSSYTFYFTSSEISALQKADTTKNSTTVRFYIKSVVGSQTFIKSVERTLTIANPYPTLNPTVYDSNSSTTSLTGNSAKIVKFASNAVCTFNASAVKGATIKSRKVTCSGQSLTGDGTIYGAQSNVFVFTVTDSRGNTTTNTITKTLVDYIVPTCYIANGTPSASGQYSLKVIGSAFNGSFGYYSNTLSVYYRYRVKDYGSWSGWYSMAVSRDGIEYTATTIVYNLDYQQDYDFQAKAVDRLNTIESGQSPVIFTPIADWSKNDFNFNVPVTVTLDGKKHNILGAGCTAHMGSNLGTVSSNVQAPMTVMDASYGGMSLSGGGIVVPEDGLYMVSGQIMVSDGANGHYLGLQINGSYSGTILDAYVGFSVGYGVIASVPTIVQLQAGETLNMYARMSNATSGVIVNANTRTKMTVVKVF